MRPSHKPICAIVLSLAAGILLAIMMQINASLGRLIGPLESSFVVHLVGTGLALVLVARHLHHTVVQQLTKVPLKLYSCGVYGVTLVLVSNIVVPHLGMVLFTVTVITSSLVFSAIADHWGMLQPQRLPMNLWRLTGILCALVGLLLVLKG
jgi:bacterial/archaeal transporter family-2 protein